MEEVEDPENEFKAFCWFSKASSMGFLDSTFNAAKIIANGSRCLKV